MNGKVRPASPVASVRGRLIRADWAPGRVDTLEDHLVLADVKTIAVAASNCLDTDLGRAPEVVDRRTPRNVDRIAVLLTERLGVGAHANRADMELTRDRGPGKASDHRGIAHEMGRTRVPHCSQHLVERSPGRDHDGLHRRLGRNVEQRRAGVRRLACRQHGQPCRTYVQAREALVAHLPPPGEAGECDELLPIPYVYAAHAA